MDASGNGVKWDQKKGLCRRLGVYSPKRIQQKTAGLGTVQGPSRDGLSTRSLRQARAAPSASATSISFPVPDGEFEETQRKHLPVSR